MTFNDQKQISENASFQGLVLIGASRFANDFLAEEKTFPLLDEADPPKQINQEAERYLNKMHNFSVKVLNLQANKEGGLINTIQNLLAILIADNLPITLADLEGADMDEFIKDNIEAFGAMTLTCFERLSGVSQKEKQEYDTI